MKAIFRALVMLGLSVVLVPAIVPDASANGGNNVVRLSADFQNSSTGVNEASTNVRPNEGGLLVYSKTLSIPFKVVYITFSAQGDSHNGSALLMQALVTDSLGVTSVCQPMAGQTGAGGG